jgi:hypothetical protein
VNPTEAAALKHLRMGIEAWNRNVISPSKPFQKALNNQEAIYILLLHAGEPDSNAVKGNHPYPSQKK